MTPYQTTHRPPMPTSTLPPSSPLPAPPPSPSPICAFHSVRSLPLGAHPALRPRPPPLPWLAWVASPHHHAPSGREVDGALSRPSPKRNGAPNTCPDYCAFPGCSLSVREGSVRVVLSSIPRPPPPSPPLWLYSHHREAARRNQTRSRDPRLASMPLWTGWPATRTPGIATRRFPPAVILCELCVLICQQYTYKGGGMASCM